MKKICLCLLICLIVSGCSKKAIIETKPSEPYKIEYRTSSDSITLNITPNKGEYKLYLKDDIISKGPIEKETIINNLKSDTEYELVINEQKQKTKIHTDKVTIMRFGGDVMMTSFFKMYIDSQGVNYMWEDVSDLIKTADYSIFNLETSVSERGSDTKPEGFGFRSEPSTLKGLVDAGIDMVNLANNHVLDYGMDAFLDTMEYLKQNNIEYIGTGKNKSEASKINYQEINGIKVAFIGTTEILGYKSWAATTDKAGVFYLDKTNLEEIKNIIKEAKTNSDKVVLVTHWDREYYNTPEAETIQMAHEFIDSGADIIIGHHPHVLQGIEYYNNGIIYYSTGNFNFLIKDENASQTALFEVTFDKDKIISSKIYPVKINACKANLLSNTSSNYQTIINNMNTRCQPFKTSVNEEGIITKDY